MTVKINELIIRARIEKKPDAATPSESSKDADDGVQMKDSVELLSVNKINRER